MTKIKYRAPLKEQPSFLFHSAASYPSWLNSLLFPINFFFNWVVVPLAPYLASTALFSLPLAANSHPLAYHQLAQLPLPGSTRVIFALPTLRGETEKLLLIDKPCGLTSRTPQPTIIELSIDQPRSYRLTPSVGSSKKQSQGHRAAISHLHYDPNRGLLILGEVRAPFTSESQLLVWETTRWSLRYRLGGHRGKIYYTAITDQLGGEKGCLISLCTKNILQLSDLTTNSCLKRYKLQEGIDTTFAIDYRLQEPDPDNPYLLNFKPTGLLLNGSHQPKNTTYQVDLKKGTAVNIVDDSYEQLLSSQQLVPTASRSYLPTLSTPFIFFSLGLVALFFFDKRVYLFLPLLLFLFYNLLNPCRRKGENKDPGLLIGRRVFLKKDKLYFFDEPLDRSQEESSWPAPYQHLPLTAATGYQPHLYDPEDCPQLSEALKGVKIAYQEFDKDYLYQKGLTPLRLSFPSNDWDLCATLFSASQQAKAKTFTSRKSASDIFQWNHKMDPLRYDSYQDCFWVLQASTLTLYTPVLFFTQKTYGQAIERGIREGAGLCCPVEVAMIIASYISYADW